MANNAERHEQLMQQMANLTASLGGLTNLNPLLAQQQQTNAELSSLSTHLGGVAARIDALVAAGGVPPPSGVAGTAAAGGVTPTVPDGADYPSKPNPPDHSDLLRYEKHVQDHIQKNRYMEEYDRRRQMEALEDMFNTPYILEARRFANYDAYCRQSNYVFNVMEKWILEQRALHTNWRTKGDPPLPFCFQGKTEMEGREMREHRMRKLESVLADPNCPPLKLEYTQNILLPQLDPAVRFDPGDPSTHDPFMRTRGVAAPMVVGDRVAVTNKDGSVTYHRIQNDPMQAS